MSKKYVYLFSEGNAQMRDILGGKGAAREEPKAEQHRHHQGQHSFKIFHNSLLFGKIKKPPQI